MWKYNNARGCRLVKGKVEEKIKLTGKYTHLKVYKYIKQQSIESQGDVW